MADDDPSVLDPAQTLGQDDPLRSWADANIDWRTGKLLQQDPSKAIQSMIDRGIPPPDVHAPPQASAFADAPFMADPANIEAASPYRLAGPEAMNGWRQSVDAVNANPDSAPKPSVPLPQVPMPQPRPAEAETSPFDPAPESVPLPRERPKEAGPGASDISAKKKPSAADALGDFSKSLAGVKPVQPPPLNPVGTPSVRSPGAISAPQLAQLIALTGATAPPSALQTLGRLLVQGKA